jgi:hypothetical protein
MEPKRIEQTSHGSRPTVVERAVREGVRRALLRHKLLGEWIAVYQDGRVIRIPASDIQIGPGEEAPDAQKDRKPSNGHGQ